MGRVVEEPEPVLLGVEEVLDAGRAQRRADRVGLLGLALPVREQPRAAGPGRVAGGADHPVAEDAGPVDLRLAVGRDRSSAAARRCGVPAATSPARSSAARICCVGDRAVRALVEAEELEAVVADRREVARTPTRSRREAAPAGRGPSGPPGSSGRRDSPDTDLSSRVIASRIDHCWTPSLSRVTTRPPPPAVPGASSSSPPPPPTRGPARAGIDRRGARDACRAKEPSPAPPMLSVHSFSSPAPRGRQGAPPPETRSEPTEAPLDGQRTSGFLHKPALGASPF